MRVVNKKTKRDFQILERYEAGVVLTGPEVKSVKAGRIKLQGSFVKIKEDEAFLVNVLIPPYQPAGRRINFDSTRTRKLLLRKREIVNLSVKSNQSGLTIVPLSCYTKHGLVKVEIALARGKKKYEKREVIKRKDIEREIERELRGKRS
jgi:SsrA-binding protein